MLLVHVDHFCELKSRHNYSFFTCNKEKEFYHIYIDGEKDSVKDMCCSVPFSLVYFTVPLVLSGLLVFVVVKSDCCRRMLIIKCEV